MMWRQLRALVWLWLKLATRRMPRMGSPPRATAAPGYLLALALALVYVASAAWAGGVRLATADVRRDGYVALALWGLVLGPFCHALFALQPQLGRLRSWSRGPMLDALPITWRARAAITIVQSSPFFIMGALLLLGARATGDGGATGAALALLTSGGLCLAGSTLGILVVAGLRALGSSLARRALSTLGGYALAALALTLALVHTGTLEGLADPMWSAVEALRAQQPDPGLLALALAVAAAGCTALIERRGYDREDRPAAARRTAPPGRELALELRALWRQGILRVFVLQSVLSMLTLALVLGVLALRKTAVLPERWSAWSETIRAVVAQPVVFWGLSLLSIGGAATRRDLAARPFLATLPRSPRRTLARRARLFRWLTLPLAIALLAAATLLWSRADLLGRTGATTVALRLIMTLLGAIVAARTAASVSFVAVEPVAELDAQTRLPSPVISILVLVPLATILVAPTLGQAIVSLASIIALDLLALRAAERRIAALDDGEVDPAQESPSWQAILVLGGFLSVHGVLGQIASFIAPTLDPGLALALVLVVGAIMLGTLTLRTTGLATATPPSRRHLGFDLLGLGLGVVSGALGMAFSVLLRRLGVELPPDLAASSSGALAIGLAVVAVVPLAEELFFRGWLQGSLERELGGRAGLAILLASFAFAAAHVGSFFLPQLVLGLIAGALRRTCGRLGPSVLAHAAHNATALLLAGAWGAR